MLTRYYPPWVLVKAPGATFTRGLTAFGSPAAPGAAGVRRAFFGTRPATALPPRPLRAGAGARTASGRHAGLAAALAIRPAPDLTLAQGRTDASNRDHRRRHLPTLGSPRSPNGRGSDACGRCAVECGIR